MNENVDAPNYCERYNSNDSTSTGKESDKTVSCASASAGDTEKVNCQSVYDSENSNEQFELCFQNFDANKSNRLSDVQCWIVTNRVPHATSDKLLKILNTHLLISMPKSTKTLLESDTKFDIKPMNVSIGTIGEYYYFGIETKLKAVVNIDLHKSSVIELIMNINGISPFTSLTLSVWPILCKIYSMMIIFTETYNEALEKLKQLQYEEHVYLLESEDSVSEYQKKMVPSVRRNQLLQEYNQLHSLFVKKDGDASTLPSSLSYENEHALIKLQETQDHQSTTSKKEAKNLQLKKKEIKNKSEQVGKASSFIFVDIHPQSNNQLQFVHQVVNSSYWSIALTDNTTSQNEAQTTINEDTVEVSPVIYNENCSTNSDFNLPVLIFSDIHCSTPFESMCWLK